jgi:predicted RNA-binding Zn-ribbon protein involved in translation (DUF1610 family)
MKTKRKSKAALKQRKATHKLRHEARKKDAALKNRVAVNPALLKDAPCYSWPEFMERGFYLDMPFKCIDCGKDEVWRATQQKWWYEVAKGDLETIAVRCRRCRKTERERKELARKVHLEGLKRKHALESL